MFKFMEVIERQTNSKIIVNISDIIAIIEDGSHASIQLRDIKFPLITKESYDTVRERLQIALRSVR